MKPQSGNMIPIQDVLNKIIWDKEFGQGSFEIGYYDRVENKIILVPFQRLGLIPGDRFSFKLIGPDGEESSIPFHRVHQVFKDGELIWER
jgi:uncharacterized protein (UPF0248 family)